MLVEGRCAAPALGDELRVTVAAVCRGPGLRRAAQASAPASPSLVSAAAWRPAPPHPAQPGARPPESRNVSKPTSACPPQSALGPLGSLGGEQGLGRGQAQATPLAKAGGEPLPNARVPAPPSLVETRPQGGGSEQGRPPATHCGCTWAGHSTRHPRQEAEALQRGQRPRSIPTPELRQLCRLGTARFQEPCTLHSPWRPMLINAVSGRWLPQ